MGCPRLHTVSITTTAMVTKHVDRPTLVKPYACVYIVCVFIHVCLGDTLAQLEPKRIRLVGFSEVGEVVLTKKRRQNSGQVKTQ